MEDFDAVAIGAGPANLALIVAMLDARDAGLPVPTAIFLEREPRFAWHPGALLPGTRVQIPFTKDLATQRNPRSRYTFLNYLREQGRLEDFINMRDIFPEREEFAGYLGWIAREASPLIRYSTDVVELFPITGAGGSVDRIGVSFREPLGRVSRMVARSLVVGTGCRPRIPFPLLPSDPRVIHTSRLLDMVSSNSGVWRISGDPCFAVIGGGESAIEAACFLLHEYPRAHVELWLRRYAPHAIDDNPFINQWFGNRWAGAFHELDEQTRQRVNADLADSNFGVAERGLLEDLYRYYYKGLRTGKPRVSFVFGHTLERVEIVGGRVACWLRGLTTEVCQQRNVDGVVLGTGYEEVEPALLRSLDRWLVRDLDGRYIPDKDYCLRTADGFGASVFLHGMRRDWHGPSETGLSMRAVTAGNLYKALCAVLGSNAR